MDDVTDNYLGENWALPTLCHVSKEYFTCRVKNLDMSGWDQIGSLFYVHTRAHGAVAQNETQTKNGVSHAGNHV